MKKTLLLALIPFLSGCGLGLVKGPAPGWETANVEALETMAVSQPCTTGKGVLLVDALFGGAFGLYGLALLVQDWYPVGLAGLGMAVPFVAAGITGNQKVNECRAFNAHVLELRQGGASSLTSYEWLDELFPLPDLGVTGLDPIFGVPINQDH